MTFRHLRFTLNKLHNLPILWIFCMQIPVPILVPTNLSTATIILLDPLGFTHFPFPRFILRHNHDLLSRPQQERWFPRLATIVAPQQLAEAVCARHVLGPLPESVVQEGLIVPIQILAVVVAVPDIGVSVQLPEGTQPVSSALVTVKGKGLQLAPAGFGGLGMEEGVAQPKSAA